MGAEPVLNLDELLTPVSGENPSGKDLKYSGLHDQIREARRGEADIPLTLDEAKGEWKHELKVEDWPEVENLAVSALASQTKDLQVSSWLAEAAVKLHGFVGLRDSLRLTTGLLEQFWDTLYPEVEDGDLEGRANALAWMNRQLAAAIKEVPVLRTIERTEYGYFKYEESRAFNIPENRDSLSSEESERIEELERRAQEEGKLTSQQWRHAVDACDPQFIREIHALLGECREAFRTLDGTVDEKFGKQTPGFSELKKGLEGVGALIDGIVKEKRLLMPGGTEEREVPGEDLTAGREAYSRVGRSAGGATGPIGSREDALRRLGEVAEYFRAAEPHSPVSYLVQRAVHWGQMPLDAWLAEVIKDSSILESLRETLGLTTAGGDSS